MAREVNISLRGVLEDLPQEVAHLLGVALIKIGNADAQINDVIGRLEAGTEVEHCLVDLDSARQSLYKIDARVSDCINILAGYIQHKEGPDEALPQQVPEVGVKESNVE